MTHRSEREREIARFVTSELTDSEIASNLGLSEAEVRRNIQSLIEKLGLVDRLDLVLHLVKGRL